MVCYTPASVSHYVEFYNSANIAISWTNRFSCFSNVLVIIQLLFHVNDLITNTCKNMIKYVPVMFLGAWKAYNYTMQVCQKSKQTIELKFKSYRIA